MSDKKDVILPWVELQDLLMYFHTLGDEKAVAMLRGLHAVHETVSLEGVYYLKSKEDFAERLDKSGWWPTGDAQWDGAEKLRLEILSDLRRLVTPVDLHDFYLWRRTVGFDDHETMSEDYSEEEIEVVENIRELIKSKQPSAVVTTEEPVGWVWSYLGDVHFSSTRPQWADDPLPSGAEAVEVRPVYASAPQPVAPVQGGGVEAIAQRLKEISEEASEQGYPFKGDWFHWYAERLAHLTTTQSAPSVGSVPTDDNHVKNVINGWKKSWSVRLSSRAEGALRDRIEKLLTSRTEGQ